MADKIFRVNMTDLSTSIEDIPDDWTGLGGRGLTSTIVAAEVPPTCHPLGPNNKLVFAPGLLSGTAAVNSGRLSCGSKSPLTGTIKECNSGGTAAQILARMGCKALIVEGQPKDDSWHSLSVTPDGVTIATEEEVIGKGNYAVIENIEKRFSDKIGLMSIGHAGEMQMSTANISVKDPDHHIRSLGRGGLGAVMGSKKIKFITLDAAGGKVEIVDKDAFRAANKIFSKALVSHPVSKSLADYGTNVLVNIINEAGGFPTRNFTSGQYENHEQISGETMRDIIVERGGKPKHGCHPGCVIQCSQIYNDAKGKYLTSGIEYESVWAMGANCTTTDMDKIAEMDHIMDDIGVDSIEVAATFAVAMEGGILEFGDVDEMIRIMKEELAQGTPLGRIIGSGAGTVGKLYGLTRVAVVKNQAIPAYDPRAIKGIGITYATSTQGADHTMGYTIATEILAAGGTVDPLSKVGQVELSRKLQIATAANDSTGMCLFIAFAALDDGDCIPEVAKMLNARFGTSLTADDITSLGKKILKTERAFNQAAGFTNAADRLPEFFSLEPIAPHNVVFDFTDDEIDAFWDF